MTPEQKKAVIYASAKLNSVKTELIRIYSGLAYAGCEREAETLRNVCRNLEDRQQAWANRVAKAKAVAG